MKHCGKSTKMKTVDEAVLEKAIKALEDFAYRGRCDNWSEALIALDAVLEQPDQESGPEPSVAQLNAILDGLGAAPGARQSAREFLRVWIRDWTMHKLALAQEPAAISHNHEWFRTGGMKPGQYRCIHCGTWAQEQQDPSAYKITGKLGDICHFKSTSVRKGDVVYTVPPRVEWVSLTNEEIVQIFDDGLEGGDWADIVRAIEARLKEKNYV